MNKIYKKIFNKSRGCFVAVSEALTSASQSSGKAAAAVVIGSTLMIAPSAFAEINTAQWATEVDHTAEINHVIDFQGGTYGQIVGFTSWDDRSRMALVNITSTGGLTGGVYGHNDFIGDAGTLGSSGKLRHWAIDNSGSIVDSTTVPTRDDGITTQIGTTNWINKFANRAGATLNVFDLRSSEILNESDNFTTVGLHLQDGGQLENKGTMNVGSFRVGVVDDGLFSKNQVRTADDTVVLPNVTYNEDGTTSVLNEGTINAETAHIAGVLTNKNAFNTTDVNGEKSSFGTTHNEGTISLAADADFGVLNQTTDASEVSGKNITVAKELNNTKGSLTATEKLSVEGLLTNATTASIEAKSVEIKGAGTESAQNTNAGTISATDGVAVSGKFSNTGTIEAGKGLTVTGTTAELGGTINGDALTLADATATINSDQVKLKKLAGSGTSTLSNSHNLEFDNINAGAGFTYNQTAGSISSKDNSFFTGSTLNISGGKLERVASRTDTLGTGNTVNISGANALAATDQGKLNVGWSDNQTMVKVGTLDSNSTVSVATGGVLESGKLALTSQSLTLNGGTLINSLSDLFEVTGEEAFTIDEGLKTELESSVLGAKDVKGLKTDITNNIVFGENGGNFVISDEYVSEQALKSASDALKAAAAGKTTVVAYTGVLNEGTESGNAFYHGTYTLLKDEQEADSAFKVPGLVFNMVYQNKENATADNLGKLVIGNIGADTDTHYVDQSIGFIKVEGSDDVAVQDGKTFVLTGTAEGGELLNTAAGKVSVSGENSRFLLGNKGIAGTSGHAGGVSIAEKGSFATVAGTYTVDKAELAEGSATVAADSTLNVGDFVDAANSSTTNNGTLLVTKAENINGAFVNAGTTTVQGDATNLNSSYQNNAGVSTFNKANIKGGLVNAQDAKFVAEQGFTVDSALTGSEVVNSGRIVSYGVNAIDGKLTVEKGAYVLAQDSTTVGGNLALSGRALFHDVKAATGGVIGISNGGLLVSEGTLGADELSSLMVGARSQAVAQTVNVFGTILANKTGSITFGSKALRTVDTSDIKGDDYRETTRTVRRMVAKAASDGYAPSIAPEAPNGRHYALDQSTFTSTGINGSYISSMIWGGIENGDSIAIVDVTFYTEGEDHGHLDLSTNCYVLADNTLTIGEGALLTAEDWDSEDNGIWETNLIVRGAVNMGGSSRIDSLVVADGGAYNVQATGTDSGKLMTLIGAYNVEEGGISAYKTLAMSNGATVINNGTFSVDTGDVGEGATVINNNKFTVNGDLNVAGTIDGSDGRITAQNVSVATTGSLTQDRVTGNLHNSGAVHLGSVSNFGADQTYTQYGDAATLEITDGTWFNGSNIVYDGGANIEIADLAYSSGTLGANTVTIKGDVAPVITMGEPNTGTFDGMTTVHVKTLTDETKVSVLEGGRLIIDELSGSADALLNGGVLDLNIAEVSKPGEQIGGILIGAESAKDQTVVDSDILNNKVSLAFSDEKLQGFDLAKGVISLTSDHANTLGDINSIAQGFATKGDITTVYNGTLAGTSADDGKLKVQTINDLFAEQTDKGGTEVNTPGVVLSQYNLSLENGDTVNYTTDSSAENGIAGSIGFAKIEGAKNLNVADGLTASLTGSAMADPENLDWSDANRILVGADAGVGGTVTTAADGKMDFGSHGTAQKNSGWIDKLANDGASTVKNFVLGVKDMVNGGTTEVASNGKIIANKFEVAEGGKYTNKGETVLGTDDADEVVNLAGELSNEGKLDAAKVETVNVTGTANNSGNAGYNDMTIAAGGTSANSGTEQGHNLTVEGTHSNTGTSIWDTSYAVAENSKSENAGKLDVGTGFDVAGDFTNKGADAVLDATKVPTTNITGTITNEGKANYQDMLVEKDATSTNSGTEQGNYLTVAGTHTNTGTSIWKTGLEVQPDAIASNAGKLDVDKAFVIAGSYENKPGAEIDATGVPNTEIKGSLLNDGTANYADMNIDKDGKSDNNGYEKGNNLTVGGTHSNTGTSIWNQITTDGGKLVVDGGKTEAGQADVKPGSTIEVPKGILAVNGMTADEADKASDKDAILGMGGSLDVTGSTVIIGTVDPADTVEEGDVYFGEDSALVIDTTKLTGDKGITGDGKITVKDGSNLVVTNASWGKHVLVTSGLETEDDGVSWRGDNLVNLTDKELGVTVIEDGYLLSAGDKQGNTDIGSLDDRYLVPDTINGLIDTEEGAKIRDVNSEHPDVMIIDRLLDKTFVGENAEGGLDVDKSVKMLNSITGFHAATGFGAYANSQNFDNIASVEDHLSDWDSKHERTLWIDAVGSTTRMDNLGLQGTRTGYKADTYGFILGADAPLPNKSAVLGAAFAYSRGDLKSRGDYLPNKTDVDSYAFSIYGAYDFNGKATVSGQIGYGWSKGDSSMNFSDIQGNGYHVTGDNKAKTFFAGVRADKKIDLHNGVSMVPHIGLRLAHTSYDGYDTKINGKSAFHNKADSTTLVQMPIGVAFKPEFRSLKA